jgi:hypothetical protein
VLNRFQKQTLTATQAAEQLELSPSRLYALSTTYNIARAQKQKPLWAPGISGGNHAKPWPQPVLDLLKKRLACKPPCPYSFAASEAHQYWQGRLPAYFASEQITEIELANPQIDALRAHRNAHEVHRELRQTPQRAWDQARKEKRSVLRPVSRCPWWDYVWSLRTAIKVGSDGRVPVGTQRLRIERPPQTKVLLYLHPTGHHSVLASPPDPKQKPVLLFTNRPQ